MNLSPDRYGHWVVAGKKYSNKLRAATDAACSGHWIHWDFNEGEFSLWDWSQEPSETLRELYDRRARYLRNKFQHLALEFSGGADSWNMLYSFCRQGLHVDTIIHKFAEKTISDRNDLSSENQWAEGVFQAWPSFQALLELNPRMKWNTWNVEDNIIDSWQGNTVDLFFHNNLHPGAIIKTPDQSNINPFAIPEVPTTGYLLGIDKPNVLIKDNGWYMYFPDGPVINRSVMERSILDIGWTDVLWYWDAECIPLMIKQGHVIRNYFRNNPNKLPLLAHRPSYLAIVNQLIYPEYQPMWQSKKAQGLFAVTSEDWFINQYEHLSTQKWHQNLDQYSNYVESITSNTDLKNYTNKDVAADYTILSDCWSKYYYLGPK